MKNLKISFNHLIEVNKKEQQSSHTEQRSSFRPVLSTPRYELPPTSVENKFVKILTGAVPLRKFLILPLIPKDFLYFHRFPKISCTSIDFLDFHGTSIRLPLGCTGLPSRCGPLAFCHLRFIERTTEQ